MKDSLDLSAVQIHNSHDVKGWPATAQITKLEFRASGVHVEHSKRLGGGAWPNFRPAGWDGDLQYTLWIFLKIGGQWHGSGCIQFWQDCDQNGGPPEQFARNWYYAADRWAPMTGYQPAPGESVGFMVSAGDARNSGAQSVQERSNIVLMPFPSSGAEYVPSGNEPTPDPIPSPTPDPPPPLPPDNPLSEKFAQMFDLYNDLKQRQAALEARIDAMPQGGPVTAGWRGQAQFSAYGIPIKTTVVVDTPMTPAQMDEYKNTK